jgi:hypothetical protein
MIAHAQFRRMMACPTELSLTEQVRLNRHLDSCLDCRSAAALMTENRSQLRSLGRLRPPPEHREAILAAADRSQEVASQLLPIVFAFLIVPLSLVSIALVMNYGWTALAGIIAFIVLFGAATVWHASRIGGISELPLRPERSSAVPALIRTLAVDVGGMIGGIVVLVGAVALVSLLARAVR